MEPLAGARALPLRVALGWVLVAVVAAQLVGGLVAGLAHASDPSADSIILPAMLTTTGTLLLVALLAPRLAGVPLGAALGLRRAPFGVFVAAAAGTTLLGPTADGLMRLAQTLAPEITLGAVPALNEAVAETALWAAWPAFALLPGLSEELLFRGLLQRAAPRGWRAIVLSAVLFALIHVDPHHVIGVLPIGLFLAWVGERAGTLVTTIAHVVNNTAAIFVARSGELQVGYGTGESVPWPWIAASFLGTLACARAVARRTQAGTSAPTAARANASS